MMQGHRHRQGNGLMKLRISFAALIVIGSIVKLVLHSVSMIDLVFANSIIIVLSLVLALDSYYMASNTMVSIGQKSLRHNNPHLTIKALDA